MSAVCNRIKQRGFTVETRLHMAADIRCNTKVLLDGQLDNPAIVFQRSKYAGSMIRFYYCASDQALPHAVSMVVPAIAVLVAACGVNACQSGAMLSGPGPTRVMGYLLRSR